MLRNARSVSVAVATLTPLVAFAVGEAAYHYDSNNNVVHAKQQLLKWRSSCEIEKHTEDSKTGASAWLGSAPPKFPYLLSISAGDNPAIVTNALLTGAKVLGSYDEPTNDTLKRLTAPTSSVALAVHRIATQYTALMTALHGNVPEDFDPRVVIKASAEERMMDALLDALRDLQYSDTNSADKGEADAATNSTADEVSAPPVFLLRDFDTLSDQDAERWLRWTHQVSSEGLAHVEKHELQLLPDTNQMSKEPTSDQGEPTEGHVKRAMELELILSTTGNWWSDIDDICQRLKNSNLNDAHNEERLATIQEVCSSFIRDTEVKLLQALHLDGSLQFPRANDHSDSLSRDSDDAADITDTSKAFSALETWKCLETFADVAPVTGGSSLIGSPQQLLDQKSKTPLNCVNPVEALMPFNYREEGEQKFLDLMDQQVLFLRPKDAVEIGVIPCNKAALVSPCWIQTRPAIKKAFEKIHMRKEVDQYEQEIAERRKSLFDMKRDFTILQFSMTPAKKAQRKAELALIDIELQAKDVYLEKLRSLLTAPIV
ncbi:uncharacterized protein PITG_10009 [Phytophthora infestans T30-4]|uniref:Uncharacterized protein n=1 Tax=Phytophthora infestans (strain T30-4) TaxID=403677 RepID=D0NE26_PHYIT|nr:uncharacterized protein PITG_10009 [Phytophthora infestans T30-4]EEY56471.1 hypothetical protein PITG_10009 [Phytophthora infestans T30-4]|eukprot:XP_002902545.1 hypothetical protein PITG_10009 [Phytophthora infestans T30-4]